MARAPCWLHVTIAVLGITFFLSTLALVATFPLPHGRMSRCGTLSLLRVNPQHTNAPTSAIDDNDGITDTPATPATEPCVRKFHLGVSGLGRSPRRLQIVFVNKDSTTTTTTTEQATIPEQQRSHHHKNKNNRKKQQIMRLVQLQGGKRLAWRLQRLGEARARGKKQKQKQKQAEALIREQLTGRREHGASADGHAMMLVRRLRAALSLRHSRSSSPPRNFALAPDKAKKSNRKGSHGTANRVRVANIALLRGLPIWLL